MSFLPLNVQNQHLRELDDFVFVGGVVWKFTAVALHLSLFNVAQAVVKDGSQIRVVGWRAQLEKAVEPRDRGSRAEVRRCDCRFDDSCYSIQHL